MVKDLNYPSFLSSPFFLSLPFLFSSSLPYLFAPPPLAARATSRRPPPSHAPAGPCSRHEMARGVARGGKGGKRLHGAGRSHVLLAPPPPKCSRERVFWGSRAEAEGGAPVWQGSVRSRFWSRSWSPAKQGLTTYLQPAATFQ